MLVYMMMESKAFSVIYSDSVVKEGNFFFFLDKSYLRSTVHIVSHYSSNNPINQTQYQLKVKIIRIFSAK